MLGPVILDKEEENQIDHTKDKTKLISNIRKHPMRPNQTRMYDASFSLFKEEEITFQHKWAFISDISKQNGSDFSSGFLVKNKTKIFSTYLARHGSYKWIIMHEKCGRPDSNGFQLKWRFGTYGHWKSQNPGGRFGATS